MKSKHQLLTTQPSLLLVRLPPTSTLFPYTTLFRSDGTTSPAYPEKSVLMTVTIVPALAPCPVASPMVTDSAPFGHGADRKSTRLNSSHVSISYAVFCLKKKSRPKEVNERAWILHCN